jgi:hypothetical protein
MTATTEVRDATPAGMVSKARAILAEVVDSLPRLGGEQAQEAVGWQVDTAREALREYDAVLNGDMDPLRVGAPDMGWWEDPEASALEYAADQARECAKAAARMLAEKISAGEKGREGGALRTGGEQGK